jgi:hypothetical protein
MQWTPTGGRDAAKRSLGRARRRGAFAATAGALTAAAVMAAGSATAIAQAPHPPEHLEFHVANHSDRDLKLASVSPISGTAHFPGGDEPLFPFDVVHRPHDGSVLGAKASQAFTIRRSGRKLYGLSSAVVQYRVEGKVRGSELWVQYYIAANDTNSPKQADVVMDGCSFSTHERHHFTGNDLGESRGQDVFQDYVCTGLPWGGKAFSFTT